MKNRIYRRDLDLLKGVSILAVVLYHMGISRSGYLGVDAFFAINGIFIVPKVGWLYGGVPAKPIKPLQTVK